MAISKQGNNLQFTGSGSVSVAAAAINSSDTFNISTDCIALSLQIEATNNGTPASGDYIDAYLAFTNGDVGSGSGSDTFDTFEARDLYYVARLDTFENALDGAAPDGGTVRTTIPDVPIGTKGFRLVLDSNAAANGITVRARVYETRSGG